MDNKQSLSKRHFIQVAPIAAVTFGACSSPDANEESSIPSPDYTISGSGFHGKEKNKNDWSVDDRSGKVILKSMSNGTKTYNLIRCSTGSRDRDL